jgi:hypothetical protein
VEVMIEADVSRGQVEYILKLQFQSALSGDVGLCDVADSQYPNKDSRYIVMSESSP